MTTRKINNRNTNKKSNTSKKSNRTKKKQATRYYGGSAESCMQKLLQYV